MLPRPVTRPTTLYNDSVSFFYVLCIPAYLKGQNRHDFHFDWRELNSKQGFFVFFFYSSKVLRESFPRFMPPAVKKKKYKKNNYNKIKGEGDFYRRVKPDCTTSDSEKTVQGGDGKKGGAMLGTFGGRAWGFQKKGKKVNHDSFSRFFYSILHPIPPIIFYKCPMKNKKKKKFPSLEKD